MKQPYTPPFPAPHKTRSSLVLRFFRAWTSWIHGLFEKSYTMLMGEIRMPGLHIFLPNELHLVDEVMQETKTYPKNRLLVEALKPAIGVSAFTANGEDWEQQRHMINPAFQHTALPRTLGLMCDAAADLVEGIRAGLRREEPGGSGIVDVEPAMTHVAADIIFRTLFSVALEPSGSAAIYRHFNQFQRYAQSASVLRTYGLPSFGFTWLSQREARGIHRAFAPIVEERYARFHDHGEIVHRDMLQSLFEARHPVTAEPFTCQQVMEQVSGIFLAGHETSASLLAWASFLLAECPEIQQRLRDEVARETGGGPITAEALKAMTLTRNVVRETLRLYPPVSFFAREASCPVSMRDKSIAAGDVVVVSPWLIHRNARNWTCPHAFDPDRYDEAEGQDMLKRAWLPFGKGSRLCMGAGFAQQEAAVVLAHMVRHFTLESLPGDLPEPVSRMTLRARRGIRLKLTLRG